MGDETSPPLNILFVGSGGAETRRVIRELRRGGLSPRHEAVETGQALRETLARGGWHLVISGTTGRELDPARALAITKEIAPELPFVVVSDILSEELCVELIRAGAADWVTVPKLSRLGPIVAREVQQARTRTPPLETSVSHRVLAAQEAERRRIGATLHDDFGQILVALRLILQAVEGGTGSGRTDLTQAIGLVDQAIQQTRDLSVELWPAVLDHLGLPAALSWLAERLGPGADLRVEVSVAAVGRLPFVIEAAGFRVAQEALANVVRHAGARSVEVTLSASTDTIELSVRDDGRGFDLERAWREASGGASLGLVAMRERARLAGGWLEVESTPGQGTLVRARLPLGRDA